MHRHCSRFHKNHVAAVAKRGRREVLLFRSPTSSQHQMLPSQSSRTALPVKSSMHHATREVSVSQDGGGRSLACVPWILRPVGRTLACSQPRLSKVDFPTAFDATCPMTFPGSERPGPHGMVRHLRAGPAPGSPTRSVCRVELALFPLAPSRLLEVSSDNPRVAPSRSGRC